MASPRCVVASIAFLALFALSSHAQSPEKPKPRPVTIVYRTRGGGTAKAEGTWTPPARPGRAAGSRIATPRAAGGFASVTPYVIVSPAGAKGVAFNAYDSAGRLVATTSPSMAAGAGGVIGNGTYDINRGATGLAQGYGIGIMQFTVGP